MIIIQAYLQVRPEKRGGFLEQAEFLVEKSREEAGNLAYTLYEAVEEPNAFVVLEKWKDQAAVNEHNHTDHFVNFFQTADQLLVKPLKADIHEVPDPS